MIILFLFFTAIFAETDLSCENENLELAKLQSLTSMKLPSKKIFLEKCMKKMFSEDNDSEKMLCTNLYIEIRDMERVMKRTPKICEKVVEVELGVTAGLRESTVTDSISSSVTPTTIAPTRPDCDLKRTDYGIGSICGHYQKNLEKSTTSDITPSSSDLPVSNAPTQPDCNLKRTDYGIGSICHHYQKNPQKSTPLTTPSTSSSPLSPETTESTASESKPKRSASSTQPDCDLKRSDYGMGSICSHYTNNVATTTIAPVCTKTTPHLLNLRQQRTSCQDTYRMTKNISTLWRCDSIQKMIKQEEIRIC